MRSISGFSGYGALHIRISRIRLFRQQEAHRSLKTPVFMRVSHFTHFRIFRIWIEWGKKKISPTPPKRKKKEIYI